MEDLSEHLGYTFQSKHLLRRAFVHESTSRDNATERHHARLLLVGRRVWQLILAERLQGVLKGASLTEMETAMASFASTTRCSAYAVTLHLSGHVRVGTGVDAHATEVLSDVFLAVLGAAYFDSGLPAVARIASRVLGDELPPSTTGSSITVSPRTSPRTSPRKEPAPPNKASATEGGGGGGGPESLEGTRPRRRSSAERGRMPALPEHGRFQEPRHSEHKKATTSSNLRDSLKRGLSRDELRRPSVAMVSTSVEANVPLPSVESTNPKADLNHWCLVCHGDYPGYIVKRLPDTTYSCEIEVGGRPMGSGCGASRLDAESHAARAVLQRLQDACDRLVSMF